MPIFYISVVSQAKTKLKDLATKLPISLSTLGTCELISPTQLSPTQFRLSSNKSKQAIFRLLKNTISSTKNECDFYIRSQDEYNQAKKLVAFDMDATLVVEETLDELATHVGIGEEIASLTKLAMQGEIDFSTSFIKRMNLLSGASIKIAEKIRSTMKLQKGAKELCDTLHAHNIEILLVSGGLDFFALPVAQELKIDHICTNKLIVQDGKITANVIEPIVDSQVKLTRVQELMQEKNLHPHQVCAVGDGANDLPMLEYVGLGVAFCGKPKLRERIYNQLNTPDLSLLIPQIFHSNL